MSFSFIKTGNASVALAEQAEKEAEIRREQTGKLWRFFLSQIKNSSKYEDARITFVDGDLNSEGFLTPPRWYEHMMYLSGTWTNFVCPEKTNPTSGDKCPLCESGDKPSLVAGFTIIDHRQYKSQKGDIYADTRKLFIAKPQTFEILNKMAVKRNGLAGCSFDVSRTGDKSPSVGSVFDFCEKKPVMEIQAAYMKETTDPKTNQKTKGTYFIPADYENEIVYRTGAELTALVGGAPAQTTNNQQSSGSTVDYAKEL